MGALPRTRPARLRDYGAFETDISAWPTQKMVAVSAPGPVQKQAQVFPMSVEGVVGSDEGKPRKKALGKWLKLLGRPLLTCILLVLLARSISWQTLLDSLSSTQPSLLLVGMVVGAFGIVVSSYQWRSLLLAERIQSDLASLIHLYLVGLAFSHFLPTGMGGDAVKAMYVGRDSGNGPGSVSAVIMSRVTGFWGMVLLLLPVLLFWGAQFSSQLLLWLALLSLGVGGAIALALSCAILLPRLTSSSKPALPWLRTFLGKTVLMGDALKMALKRPTSLLSATCIGALFWLISCLNYYVYAYAIGITAPLHFYGIVIPFISLLAALPITINGFGVREGAFVYAFSLIHVPVSQSLLLVLLMDVQVLLFGVMGGGIYMLMGNKKRKAI